MSEKEQVEVEEKTTIDLSYIEVNATVDANVTVDLDHVLDSLSLEKLKAVKNWVDEAIKCTECEEEDCPEDCLKIKNTEEATSEHEADWQVRQTKRRETSEKEPTDAGFARQTEVRLGGGSYTETPYKEEEPSARQTEKMCIAWNYADNKCVSDGKVPSHYYQVEKADLEDMIKKLRAGYPIQSDSYREKYLPEEK